MEVNGNIAEYKLEEEFWNYIFDINHADKIDKAIE
jgi:predicted DNA-binding ribbon-helix-helix protein